MKQHISSIALVVADYDEAIDWYTRMLGFVVIEDTVQSMDKPGVEKRWVLLSPPGAQETRLLLAKASNPQQRERVGDQAGGRVFLLLQTDDFWRDYRRMQTQGATFCEEPREEAYGTVVVFEDLYGNRWDLLQLKT